jgi:hypothetical protein
MRKRREDKRKIIYLRRSLGPIKKQFDPRIFICQAIRPIRAIEYRNE